MALAGCTDQIGLIRGDGPPVSSIRGNLKRHPRPGKYQIRAGQVASRSLMVEILSNGDGTDRDGIPDDKDEDDSGLAAHVGDDAVGRPRDAGRASGVEVEDAVADAEAFESATITFFGDLTDTLRDLLGPRRSVCR